MNAHSDSSVVPSVPRTVVNGGTSAAHAVAAVQSGLRAHGARHIGDLISWNTNCVDVPRVDAREVFALVGLEKLIADMDPQTALNRAVKEARLRRQDGFTAMPFKRPNSDAAMAWGIYRVESKDGETGDALVLGARVRLIGSLAVVSPPEAGEPDGECMERGRVIVEHANHLITHVETRDMSGALTATVNALSGVPLRNRGGFYLLPPATCEQWASLRPGLERMGVGPFVIEMFDSPQALQTAATAARSALESDIVELVADLEKAKTDGLRSDALERRLAACESLCARATLFRDVLQDMAATIEERAQALKSAFIASMEKPVVAAGVDVASDDDPDAAMFRLDADAA
jgi:hypothetical protein